MRINVTRSNNGGTIDAEVVEVVDHPDNAEIIDAKCQDVIRGWTLGVGDAITIREV